MANLPAKAKLNLPANINQQLAEQAAKIYERVSAPQGDKITVTQAKTFRLPDGRESPGPITGIIVDFVSAYYYFETAFDRNNIVPPKCFAIGEESTMTPSENALEKQADKCKGCWANEFGSAGKGKACQNTRLLALMPADGDTSSQLMLLKVSATACRHFDNYVAAIAQTEKTMPIGVITEFFFDPNSEWASIRFRNVGLCTDDQLAIALSKQEDAQRRLRVEPEVTETQAPPPVKAKGRPTTAARR